MSFEESIKHDFRAKAFIDLINRVEEYTAILNLPIQAYKRLQKKVYSGQISLLPEEQDVFIVIGRTCAGKTTFGQHASSHHGFEWLEASSVVRMLREMENIENKEDNIQKFAEVLLKEKGMDVVARKVLQLISNKMHSSFIITGFRTFEELEVIKNELPNARIVLIDASERNRFERYVKRGRQVEVRKVEEFRRIDQDQWRFGLLRVAEDFADFKIENEGTIKEYFTQIDALLGGEFHKIRGVSEDVHSSRKGERSQLIRCMDVLDKIGKALDCNEIQDKTGETGKPIRFNNVNKILKRYPELVKRIEVGGEKVRYKIEESGRTYLRLIKAARANENT
jgi:dephospho-CoA kinase